ncbi:hypothetical protein BX600DRAFT_519085 [Xylariales sp. PMI_506]|nr:hypothetical protein BX600DRAFT_519085 [Xylariales sp. PMI_506]
MRLNSKLGYIACLTAGVFGQDVTLSAPTQVPTSASVAIDPSFLGLMFETTSWTTVANDSMSQTLIQNLVKKAGAPLIIRVGGTSGDQASYNASQTKGNYWPDHDTGLLDPVILGKPFADGFGKVSGVRYILEVPLANTTVNNTVQFTKDLLQSIDTSSLEAIEVGNEPNLYPSPGQHKRPSSYTPQDYVNELKTYISAIVNGVPDFPQRPIFHVGSLADGSSWTAKDLYDAGLGDIGPGLILAFTQHYYQTSIHSGPTLAGTLLDHAGAVVEKFGGDPQEDLDYLTSAGINTPLIISETGSALGSVGEFERGIDVVLGSALWEVDWALLAMSRGVSRANMNQCNGCNFASWWAAGGNTSSISKGSCTGDGRCIFSQYYGLSLLADWLGLPSSVPGGIGEGGFQVASLYDGAKYPNVSPYAGYVGGQLDRVVVIDLNQWNKTETTARPQRTFVVDVGTDVKTAELRRLTGSGTDATADDGSIRYAGTQYTVEIPAGTALGNETESVVVQGGKATFEMLASEAVLLLLHR